MLPRYLYAKIRGKKRLMQYDRKAGELIKWKKMLY